MRLFCSFIFCDSWQNNAVLLVFVYGYRSWAAFCRGISTPNTTPHEWWSMLRPFLTWEDEFYPSWSIAQRRLSEARLDDNTVDSTLFFGNIRPDATHRIPELKVLLNGDGDTLKWANFAIHLICVPWVSDVGLNSIRYDRFFDELEERFKRCFGLRGAFPLRKGLSSTCSWTCQYHTQGHTRHSSKHHKLGQWNVRPCCVSAHPKFGGVYESTCPHLVYFAYHTCAVSCTCWPYSF